MKILVSSCFLLPTRYDGKAQDKKEVKELLKWLNENNHEIVPVCPEQLGGLTTPREPAEIVSNSVVTKSGIDITEQFNRGASNSLDLYNKLNCDLAILKANSPSCGNKMIYDGSHNGNLIKGKGVTTKLLESKRIKVFSELEIEEIKKYICKQKI